MALIVEPSKSTAPEIPDGMHVFKVVHVKEVRLEQPDQFGKQDKIEIGVIFPDLEDDDGKPIHLEPRVNRAWSERAVLYKYAVALGVAHDVNSRIDLESFVGKSAQGLVRTDEEGGWPRIQPDSLLPIKKARQSAQEAAEAPAHDGPPSRVIQFWDNVLAAGLVRIDVVRESVAMFDKEPDQLSDKQIETLEKVLLS